MNFISYKTLIKDLTLLFLIVCSLTYLVSAYLASEDFLTNFKPYYINSFVFSLGYSLSRHNRYKVVTQVSDGSVPILLYHGIVAKDDGENVTLSTFIDQMMSLKQSGYSAISFKEYEDFMLYHKPLPSKPILITFDDGRKDSYFPVDPILQALNFRATVFIITGHSFTRPGNFYVSKEELENMKKSGRWDIQAHAANGHVSICLDSKCDKKGHYYDNKMWLKDKNRLETNEEFFQRIHTDLAKAKNDLATRLHIQSTGFAFPYGDIAEASNYSYAKSILLTEVNKDFKFSFYQWWPGRGYSQNIPINNSINRRLEVLNKWSGKDILSLLKSGDQKQLPYKNDAKESWLHIWGNENIDNQGNLWLKALPNTSGASVFLDGTSTWKNYKITTNSKLYNGEYIGVLLHYQDANNYAECRVAKDQVAIIEHKNDFQNILDTKVTKIAINSKLINVSASINNNTLSCYISNKLMLTHKLTLRANYGGIGFETWGKELNNAKVQIKDINVFAL